jgi:hypothetical protein
MLNAPPRIDDCLQLPDIVILVDRLVSCITQTVAF